MLNLPTKPRIVPETRRDDYSATVIVRWRRPWRKMTPDERITALVEAANYLDSIAAQMRDEANP